MLRSIIVTLILGGLVVAGYRIWSFHREAEPPAPEETVARAPEPSGERMAEKPAGTRAPEARTGEALPPVRDVTPEGVFSGPVQRSRPAVVEAPPPPPEEPKTKRYFRVMVQDAATLRSGTRTIALAGIEAPGPEATCRDDSGQDWPCGRAAKAALNLFLRGRAIDCETVSGNDRAITARCRSGDQDLARWLVAQGWARPSGSSDYAELAETAKREKLGLYQAEWRSGAPRGTSPSPAATSIVQD